MKNNCFLVLPKKLKGLVFAFSFSLAPCHLAIVARSERKSKGPSLRNSQLFKFFRYSLLIFCNVLTAREGHETNPHYEWVTSKEVAVLDDGIFIECHQGLMLLNVVEYDPVNDRYLVKCSCLDNDRLTPLEALSPRARDKN
jgi:hypothetical protein